MADSGTGCENCLGRERRVCVDSAPVVDRRRVQAWQYRSWIAVRAPNFDMKASVVRYFYGRRNAGKPLGSNEFVISADEKPSIHACDRATPPPQRHRAGPGDTSEPRLPPPRCARLPRCLRHHQGRVFGRCEASTGIDLFTALVDQVMTCEPDACADRVFWGVDNGSSNRGQAAIDCPTARYPNAVMVHTPRARVLAQPSRNLLLQRSTESSHTKRLSRPHRRRATSERIRRAV